MTPNLETMKKCNPMSVIGCTKSPTNELVDVYFFAGFMNVAQILKARWDAAASMAVMEIKLECGEFKVTSAEYGATADEGEHDIVLLVALRSPMHQQSTHIVKPAVQWCSCGAWQDCMFPCRHACAVYRKWI
jgi:hypothetical protein